MLFVPDLVMLGLQAFIISCYFFILGFVVYLREEASDTHRLGAIAMGGVAGFILALRGGLFR